MQIPFLLSVSIFVGYGTEKCESEMGLQYILNKFHYIWIKRNGCTECFVNIFISFDSVAAVLFIWNQACLRF